MPQPSVFASVAFLKVHDFGRRPVVEQTRLRAQLEAVVAVTLGELQQDRRIVLDAADGIALVVLGDPRGALSIAQKGLGAGAAGLPLAIGITHGAVRLTDSGSAEGLMGDGISVAAAVAEIAGPQKLLATREFHDALADAAPGAEAALAAAGTHTDASLRSHALYRSEPRGARRRRRRYALATALALVMLFGAGLAWRAALEGPRQFSDRLGAAFKSGVLKARAEVRRILTRTAP
ncbi:MAG TPA: hypothetical protein VFS80_00010 [Burkholderiales bacterium]|nr:hypothetical protein [Burkholderiales bacterium]